MGVTLSSALTLGTNFHASASSSSASSRPTVYRHGQACRVSSGRQAPLPSRNCSEVWFTNSTAATLAFVAAAQMLQRSCKNKLASPRSVLTQLKGLQPKSRQERFSARGPLLLMFDGLEDLEEEEEPEEVLEKVFAIVPKTDLGQGLLTLERLYEAFRDHDQDPQLTEERRLELHADLKEDLPRCPSISSVAWAAKALEEMELEDDDVFEVIAKQLKERSNELQPQDTLNAVISFGNIYFIDEDLVASLSAVVRMQMKEFTNAEVVRLANSMSRLGATDTTKHVGMLFEMRSRVHLPHLDNAIRAALGPDGQNSDGKGGADVAGFFNLPKDSKLKKQVLQLPADLAAMERKMLAEKALQEDFKEDWKSRTQVFGLLQNETDQELPPVGESPPVKNKR